MADLFPKELYVTRMSDAEMAEADEDASEFYINESIEECAVPEEHITVAIYKLVDLREVSLKVVVE